MSGTSMDGVDISLINTNGEKIIRLDKNFYLNYQLSTKLALAKTQKQPLTKQSIDTCFQRQDVVDLDSMKSYLEQLTIQSENQKVSLRDAFNWAGLSKTTYYRQLKGTELRFDTAIKIERAIEQLATLQKK